MVPGRSGVPPRPQLRVQHHLHSRAQLRGDAQLPALLGRPPPAPASYPVPAPAPPPAAAPAATDLEAASFGVYATLLGGLAGGVILTLLFFALVQLARSLLRWVSSSLLHGVRRRPALAMVSLGTPAATSA